MTVESQPPPAKTVIEAFVKIARRILPSDLNAEDRAACKQVRARIHAKMAKKHPAILDRWSVVAEWETHDGRPVVFFRLRPRSAVDRLGELA
jgi:hypothetical protein